MRHVVRGREPRALPLPAKLFIAAVIAAGVLVFVEFFPCCVPEQETTALLLAAVVVSSLFKLRVPLGAGYATFSVAYVIDFAVVAIAGADVAMVIAAIGALVQCTARVRRPRPWYRAAFSVAAAAISVRITGAAWLYMADAGLTTSWNLIVPLVACSLIYFALNTALIVTAITLAGDTPAPLPATQSSSL